MAALNQAETKTLSEVQALLENILRDGYDPSLVTNTAEALRAEGRTRALHVEAALKGAKSRLNDLRQRKGYYPS